MASPSPTIESIVSSSAELQSVAQLNLLADYDEENRVFQRTDGSIVAFLEVAPIPAIVLSDASLASMAEIFARSIGSLPDGAIFSYTIFSSKRINEATDAYRRAGGDDNSILKQLEESRIAFLEKGAEIPLLNYVGTDRTFRSKTFRILISVTVPPTRPIGVKEGISDFLIGLLPRPMRRALSGRRTSRSPSEERFLELRKEVTKICRQQIEQLSAKLSTFGCRTVEIEENGIIRAIRDLLYRRTGFSAPISADEFLPTYVRIPILPVTIDPQKGLVTTDGLYYRMATLHGIPRKTHPGMLTLPHVNLGDSSVLDFLEEGFITLTAQSQPQYKLRNYLKDRIERTEGNFGMPGKRDLVLTDSYRAQRWIEAEGRRFFLTQVMACCYGETEELADRRIRRLRDVLTDVNVPMRLETLAGPSYFFQALPGNAFPPVEGARREWYLPDRQVADLVPLYLRSRGTQEAVMLLHNLAGEPFPLSLWGGNSPHFIIAGTSGSGKSFFAECLGLDFLRHPDSQWIIIDKGNSFLTVTLLFGERGSYQNLGKGLCTINVLEGTYEQASRFGVTFITHLASGVNKGSEITRSQQGLIERILRRVFDDRQSQTTFFDYEELQSRFPNSFIAYARKYLPTAYISDQQQKTIDAIKGRETQFKLYYRYPLMTAAAETGESIEIRSAKDIPGDLVTWLENNRFAIEEDREGVTLLSEASDRSSMLLEHRLQASHDTVQCTVEVATVADMTALAGAGVKFIAPPELLATRAEAIRKTLMENPEFARASADLIERQVRRRVEEIAPIDIYKAIEGEALIQREVYLGDFAHELEAVAVEDEAARDLIDRLAPYYGGGSNSAFFDGKTSVHLDNLKIADFELGQLADTSNEHMLAAVMGAILHHIGVYCSSERVRHVRKMLAIDEGWQLIGHPVIAQAIINLYRTGRKYNVAVGMIAQRLSDFTDHEAGRVILDNAPNRFILKQSDQTIQALEKTMGYTPEQVALVKSMRSEAGFYSMILVQATEHSPPVFDVAMLIPNPIQYWMATTRAEDVKYREDLVEQFLLKQLPDDQARSKAIEVCAEQFPHGYRNE